MNSCLLKGRTTVEISASTPMSRLASLRKVFRVTSVRPKISFEPHSTWNSFIFSICDIIKRRCRGVLENLQVKTTLNGKTSHFTNHLIKVSCEPVIAPGVRSLQRTTVDLRVLGGTSQITRSNSGKL